MKKPAENGKRTAILRAAWKMMCLYGFAKTTVEEIARDAGIAKGTVYLYFRSKEEILIALVKETNIKVLDEMEAIAASARKPEDKLRKMMMSRAMQIYDVVQANPHGEEIIASHKPRIVESLDWFFKKQKSLYEKVIRDGIREGRFVEKSPGTAAETLSTLSELLTPPYYRLRKRSEIESFVRNVLKRFITGISSDGKVRDAGKDG
jgi:AcrR family transcriptional regulator